MAAQLACTAFADGINGTPVTGQYLIRKFFQISWTMPPKYFSQLNHGCFQLDVENGSQLGHLIVYGFIEYLVCLGGQMGISHRTSYGFVAKGTLNNREAHAIF